MTTYDLLESLTRPSGLVFQDVRLASALSTVEAWRTRYGIEQAGDADDASRARLLEELVVHESYFDRDLEQRDAIDRLALAELASRHDHLRLWSAGCAAGEETYSLAFLCAGRGLLSRAEILGTDLSRPALARARAGRYRAWSVRLGSMSPALRFLEHDGAEYRVPDEVRRVVRFEQLDLVQDKFPTEQHLITCRNVLIYFDRTAIATVARKLADALADDGWLFVAPSDPRLDEHAPLAATITDRGVHYRKAAMRTRPRPITGAPAPRVRAPSVAPIARPAVVAVPREAPATAIRALADRGATEAAREALAAALALAPLDPELHFLAAMLADDPHAALASIDRAAYLAPEIPLVHLVAGHFHVAVGDNRAARRAYEAAIATLAKLPADQRVPWSDETADMLAAAARRSLAAL